MKRPTAIVSFRIDTDLLARIDQDRATYGMSRGDWARGVLIARLFQEDHSEQHSRLEHIHVAIERLQGELNERRKRDARVLYILLTQVAEMPPEHAKDLVRRTFDQ